MLLFSTILDIHESLTKEKFIQLVIEWNQGSPHTENIISELEWHGESNVRYGDNRLWMAIDEYRNGNIVAVRYEKREADGAIWDTDYVMNFASMKMAIRLERSFTQDAVVMNRKFATPHIITLLIEKGYLRRDGVLVVGRTPHTLSKEELPLLADIVNGKAQCRLPVVYVSKTVCNHDPVDVHRMAGRLKGIAHVLVQSDVSLNTEIRTLCSDQNEYHGAIGIYHPNQMLGHRRYLYHGNGATDDLLMEKIIRTIMQYSNAQMVDLLYTWQGVNNALLGDRLQSQRAERIEMEQKLSQERTETEALLDSCEDDLQRLQERVDELMRTNEGLLYENQGLRYKLESADGQPVLYMGDECELYPGEVRELLLEVLKRALTTVVQEKSRRFDIVQDIIRNNKFEGLRGENAKELERLLSAYEGMTKPVRQGLEKLGFVISDDGKHYKLVYHGDDRYWGSLSKTPSDVRSGKNNMRDLINKVF